MKKLLTSSLAIALSFGVLTSNINAYAADGAERPSHVKAGADRTIGQGPFKRLVIRGATMIDGTGAPPIGPMDIVVENNRIVEIRNVGAPGVPIDPKRRPAKGDHEIDAEGMFVMPGFVNAHAHISNPAQFEFGEAAPADYAYRLWLGHGVTTIREVGAGNGADWTMNERDRSTANKIVAPRIASHVWFPTQLTPKEAVKWVRDLKKSGADGIKFRGASPATMKAALAEARKQGLKTAMHHEQMSVTRWDVMDSVLAGLDSMEHWYGLPEAMFEDRTVQNYPFTYNYMNEQDRFGQAGRLWKQAADAGSETWVNTQKEMLENKFTLVPTFTIYEANRDHEKARTQEALKDYTWPAIEGFFHASKTSHGSYFFDWTTGDEVEWKYNYRKWMKFVNEYKNRGGRVALGDDAGFIYKLYGFGYVREFELFQEAGFHPLEVMRAATLSGAELLGRDTEIGTIERGKLADLVITDQNPLQNFKVLYGNGTPRLNLKTNKEERVGGINYTIKDGVIYDARALIQSVKDMVAEERQRRK